MYHHLILSGAGLDTSYEIYATANISLFSVDFEEIITQRNSSKSSEQNNTHVVAADLRKPDELNKGLIAKGFKFEVRTIVVAECVLCYLDSTHCNNLLQMLSSKLKGEGLFIGYDPILDSGDDDNGFSKIMHQKFMERGQCTKLLNH